MGRVVVVTERTVQVWLNRTQPYPGQREVERLLEGLKPLRQHRYDFGGQKVELLIFGKRYVERKGILQQLIAAEDDGKKVSAVENSLMNIVYNYERRRFAPLLEGLDIKTQHEIIRTVARRLYAKHGDALVECYPGDTWILRDYEAAKEELARCLKELAER